MRTFAVQALMSAQGLACANFRKSLEACFAESVQIMPHRVWSEGQIFVYPSERHIWLHLLEPLKCCACLFDPTRLSQARTQLSMGAEVLGSLLSDIVGVVGGLVIASRLIIGLADADHKNDILRIVRTQVQSVDVLLEQAHDARDL
jgi:hypothetical protein